MQVGFADTGQIASGSREFASAPDDVRRVADEGEARLREWHSGCDGRCEIDVVSGFGDPMVLDVEYYGPVRTGLWRSQKACSNGATQISGGRTQGGVGINGTEIGDDAAADGDRFAVATGLMRMRLGVAGRTAAAAGEECGEQNCE